VAGQDLWPALVIGEEVEDQAVFGILGPRPQRQSPPQQRVEQPVLAEFELAPARQFRGVGQIGDGAVVAAGAAEIVAARFIHQPVAGVMGGVGAKIARRAFRSGRPPSLASRLERRHGPALRLEAHVVAASAA
jgi:hypothetical protein